MDDLSMDVHFHTFDDDIFFDLLYFLLTNMFFYFLQIYVLG